MDLVDQRLDLDPDLDPQLRAQLTQVARALSHTHTVGVGNAVVVVWLSGWLAGPGEGSARGHLRASPPQQQQQQPVMQRGGGARGQEEEAA